VTVSGGSAGLQVGVESSDVIMLVMGEPGMNKLLRPSLAIGADISAAAGPLGKAAEAGTDPTITTEILSYARTRGLFAGAEVSGSSLDQDSTANASMYGATDAHTILTSGVRAPKEAASFLNNITSAFPPRDAALEAALKRGASL
jgi:lipid-binding SYLF domain-containing protein